MTRHWQTRHGFALLTVLWILALVSTTAAVALLAGRSAFQSSSNRIFAERARRHAEGCVARVRAAVDAAMAAVVQSPFGAARVWQRLDRAALASDLVNGSGCTIRVEAAGTRLDVNAASPDMLQRVFASMTLPADPQALSDALVDWRDADDGPLPAGAERDWYLGAHRLPPRNAPLASVTEIARVRGFETISVFDTVLSVEPGRICLATAPASVLAALPGMNDEARERLIDRRAQSTPMDSFIELLGLVSHTTADSIMANYDEITRESTLAPDAWIVTATATEGPLPISETVEIRLIAGVGGTQLVRHRSWP